MKKLIKAIAIGMATIIGIFALFAYVLPTIATYKAEKRVFYDYENHKEILSEVMKESNLGEDPLRTLLISVDKMPLPTELQAIGIRTVCVNNEMLFVEYNDAIMGTTSYGLLYTNDITRLPDWYLVKPIADGWYFYRV